jgi:protein phosphatase 1 regulatory subunit 37
LSKGNKQPVSAPILKSAVARNLEASQEQPAEQARDPTSSIARVISAAKQHYELLQEVMQHDSLNDKPPDVLSDVLAAARVAQLQLSEATPALWPAELQRKFFTASLNKLEMTLGSVNQDLSDLCSKAEAKLATTTESPSLAAPESPAEPHSPSFSITDSDDSDDDSEAPSTQIASTVVPIDMPPSSVAEPESPRSPVESQSRHWVEEEGEVFRRKTFLDSLEDQQIEDEDISGEELRREILETEVERRPAQSPVLALDTHLQDGAPS